MSKKMIFLLIFIFILGVMNSAGEIVLQNGYNGYEARVMEKICHFVIYI